MFLGSLLASSLPDVVPAVVQRTSFKVHPCYVCVCFWARYANCTRHKTWVMPWMESDDALGWVELWVNRSLAQVRVPHGAS